VIRIVLFSLIAVVFHSFRLFSQELNCKVQVSSIQIGSDKTIYDAMQKSIYEFINNQRWTSDVFADEEKIDCSILINITERVSTDEFKATLQVQARRPVYRTSYNTNLLNINDNDFQFKYAQFENLQYSENAYVSELTSVIAYYVYVILGLDYDSFSPEGGSPYYQKAMAIVNNAVSSQYKGWKAFESNRNRYWLVQNLNDPAFKALRTCMYDYHRNGFDRMSENLDEGRNAITESLETLKALHQNRPLSYNMQVFFNAKADEIVSLYSIAPQEQKHKIVTLLSQIDPGNSAKYQKILTSK
jgi:hypothetical protein